MTCITNILKLMERHVPVCLVNLLANWYENVFISVRWGHSFVKTGPLLLVFVKAGYCPLYCLLYMLMTLSLVLKALATAVKLLGNV